MDNDEDFKNPEISPSDNKFIDELTMKLLTNQTNYAKYLYKNDSEKYEEQQQFLSEGTKRPPKIQLGLQTSARHVDWCILHMFQN